MSASAAGAAVLLRSLKLPGFVRAYEQVAEQAEREGWRFERGYEVLFVPTFKLVSALRLNSPHVRG